MAGDLVPKEAPESGHRRFVIYGSMRTGSNFLVSLLNQLPGVVCHGEVFNPNFVGLHPTYARTFRIPRKATAKRDQDPEALYKCLLDAAPQNSMVGFKIFPGHNQNILDRTLFDTQVLKIILRRDIVESFVSLCQAEENKVWLISSTDKELEHEKRHRASRPVPFDATRFLKYKKTVDAFHKGVDQKLAKNRHEVLRLEYEDLLAADASTLISTFFGLSAPRQIAPSPLAKINSLPVIQRVTNPSEMMRFLHKHGFLSAVTTI